MAAELEPKPTETAAGQRWTAAAAWFAWVAAIIAPALTFDIGLSPTSNLEILYRSFFQIICTVIFILIWKKIGNFRPWVLLLLGSAAVFLFCAFTILRELWSCGYAGLGRIVLGDVFKPAVQTYFEEANLLAAGCEQKLSHYGGDALQMWDPVALIGRFLILFGLYATAWLTLALLLLGALQRRSPAEQRP